MEHVWPCTLRCLRARNCYKMKAPPNNKTSQNPRKWRIRSYTLLLLNQTPAGNSLSLFPSSHSNGNTFLPSYLQFSPSPVQGLPYRYKLHTEPLVWEIPWSLENWKVIQKVTGALSACSKQYNPSLLETNHIHIENEKSTYPAHPFFRAS